MPATASTANMIKMASIIATSPSQATRAWYRPGPDDESQARPLPATLSVNTYHGRRKFWCAAKDNLQAWARGTPGWEGVRLHVVTGNGGGSIGNGGAERAAFMAGFGPAYDTGSRRVLAPCVSASDRPRLAAHAQA